MEGGIMHRSLAEYMDREAIRDLPLHYCACVWQRDVDGYVGLFTEDAEISVNDPIVPARNCGHQELRQMISSVFASGANVRPFIHNHTVQLTGPESAVGRCYLDARFVKEGKPWLMVGYLDDIYVKSDGRWMFQSRLVTIDSSTPIS